ncbi:BglG family transcription antiterminator [Clostridium sp.]|uniref:BglG family transcription antiterminator n=1 Tax=Clostridium sp. TaxID=1506 RepID=UPI003D6CFF9D
MSIILRKRTNQIILQICGSNKPVTVKELSELFNVSGRTIRYDLDEIDYYFEKKGLSRLIRKPNSGIELSLDAYENVIETIRCDERSSEYVLSSNERLTIILFELLQRKDFIVINDLADILCVSRTTVITDLKGVKKALEDNGLILVAMPNYGLKVEGEEDKIWAMITQLLISEAHLSTALDLDEFKLSSNIIKVLYDVDLEYIKKCIKITEEDLKLVFSDEAFTSIIIYIAVVIKRILLYRNINITMHSEDIEYIQYTTEFSVSEYIVNMIEKHFNIEIPLVEITHIAQQLLSGGVTLQEETDNKNYMELEMLINEIIKNMNKMLNVNFNCDESLFDRLINHIRPAVFRLKNNIPLKNPLIKQIKCEYGGLFDTVKECLTPLERYTDSKLSDEEIGYFTILFEVTIEKFKSIDSIGLSKNILIICSAGNSTSELLALRIDAEFDVNIVGKIAFHKMEEYIKGKKIDLIISTIPIKKPPINCILVNSFLNENDKQLLKKYLKEKSKVPHKENPKDNILQDDELIENIIRKISEYCNITDNKGLVKELRENYIITRNSINKKIFQYSLKDLLIESTISLDIIVSDWKEAVRKAGEILSENDFIEPRYTDAMIEEIENLGPYVVIGQGIALPHSRIQNGVKRVGMSFVRLKNPIKFGSKDKDPVDLVFAMCAMDKTSHRDALIQLGKILDNEDMVEVLRREKSKVKMIQKINEFLEIEGEII